MVVSVICYLAWTRNKVAYGFRRSFPNVGVLPRHVFMPFQTALAVSRSLQALGLARTFGPVRGSSWGGAEAGERLPVRSSAAQAHSASPSWLRRMPRVAAMATRATHGVAPPRVTSRPLGGRHLLRAADIISWVSTLLHPRAAEGPGWDRPVDANIGARGGYSQWGPTETQAASSSPPGEC